LYYVKIDDYPFVKMSFIEVREMLLLRGYKNVRLTPNYLSSLDKLSFSGITINIKK